MWRMVQLESPEDFVVATGEMHIVREFIEKSFAWFDTSIEWRGEGVEEVGIERKTGKTVVRIEPKYFRPAEVEQLLGNPNPAKAREKLGWAPTVTFEELVRIMVAGDWKRF
jgi:GDPmannose 4,6-dehydratase